MKYVTLENAIRNVVRGRATDSKYVTLENSIRGVVRKHKEEPGGLESGAEDEAEKTKDFDNEAARMEVKRNIVRQQKQKIIDNA